MISRDSVQTLIGGTAYTTDGDKIGSIGQVYLDNDTGQPAWVTVKTGLFGSNESFVPLNQAEQTDDGIRVPYDKDRVKDAPKGRRAAGRGGADFVERGDNGRARARSLRLAKLGAPRILEAVRFEPVGWEIRRDRLFPGCRRNRHGPPRYR